MEFEELWRQRRMVRAFEARAVSDEIARSIFEEALRAPTAGNSRGISFVTLIGPLEVERYFEAATDTQWRHSSKRYQGLRHASAIGVCVYNPELYLSRYGEADKQDSGLGVSLDAWPVPYWIGDAGAACLAAHLLVEQAGLSACFLGAFRNSDALAETLRLTEHERIYGAVLMGYASSSDYPSASTSRPGPSRQDRVRRSQVQDDSEAR